MTYTELKSLYHTICRGHAQRLFDLYNSPHNPDNLSPNTKKIEVVFSSSKTVNACARSSQTDTIILHAGLLKNIHECVHAFVNYDDTISNEQEKEMIGVFLFSVSSHFIVAHEFAHIYLGHCALSSFTSSESACLSMAYDPKMGISPLDFQTLEMNADSLAMCRTVDFTLFRPYHHRDILSKVHDQNRALELLVHAINITFFALRYMMPPMPDPTFQSRKHHPIFLRQVMNLNTLLKYIQSEYDDHVSYDDIDRILVADEAKLCDLYFIPLVADHYMNDLSPVMLQHEQGLRKNWNKIRDSLKPHTRAPLNDMIS